jgi:hypothetical protein
MGMYDEIYVHSDIVLPNFPINGNRVFQTKDFDCALDRYDITAKGKLTKEDCSYEEVPENLRPYFNDPDFTKNGILRYAGSLKKNIKGIIDTNFNGTINFYTSINGNWIEYIATFVEGILITIQPLD